MAFGVTPEGYSARTQQDILDEIEADQRALIDPLIDTDPDQPLGQLNGIYARQLAKLEELAEVAYHAFDPDKAEDDRLIALCKLTGTNKQGATYSRVACTVVFDADTTLVSGTNFAAVDGHPDVRFTPEADFSGAAGTHPNVTFRAELTGPVAAATGDLTVIATPVVGWVSITNPDDATEGEPDDTNETLRRRREDELAAKGSSTVDAISADVLRITLADGTRPVQSCVTLNNPTSFFDSNGLPPHSFEVLLYDGTPPAVDDDVIAQAIWDTKAAGILAFGSSSGTAADRDGDPQTVAFSRVTARDVYLEYDIDTGAGYVGDTALKQGIAELANEIYQESGADVLYSRLLGLPYQFAGVTRVTSLKLGFSPSPTLSVDLPIGLRQLARFDTANITIL